MGLSKEWRFFTDKKRYQFRWHSGRRSKGDIDKSRDHQKEGSSQTGGASQYKPKKKFEGNCYNYVERSHMVKDCWSKKKSEESNVTTSNQKKDNEN